MNAAASDNASQSFLDQSVQQAQAAVEQKFLFRKIGLPFDYASSPDDFPSKAFATAKEARNNLPNPSGLGAGYHFANRNHAVLFDAYLLRIETGIEGSGDEAILDRLIGGLIRLATVAPKSFLVGGLAPDGRGFFAQPVRENHVAWSFSTMRGLATAAIAPESQEKFRSIAGKWIDRIKREKFRLCGVDGKPLPDGDLSRPEADGGPLLLAMLLTAAKASGEGGDYELYAELAAENSHARLDAYAPAEGWSGRMRELLWRQAAWSVLADHDPDPRRAEIARERLRDNARAAEPFLSAWRKWDPASAEAAVDLNWRTFPKAQPGESPYGFVPPPSWARIDGERFVEDALNAAYVLLLAGDAELAEPGSEEIGTCLRTVPWGSLVTLTAVAPAIAVHARGAELGLWDKELYDARRESPSSEVSFAAKYLEENYDASNPDKAGHAGPPPGKRRPGPARTDEAVAAHGKKRRRRKRK